MRARCRLPTAVLVMLMASQATALGDDWGSHIAKHVIGRAVRAGLQEAIEDAVEDAAFDAALDAAIPDREVPEIRELGDDTSEVIGSIASAGVEAAMIGANVASAIDTATDIADAAKAVHKANKVLKTIQKFR